MFHVAVVANTHHPASRPLETSNVLASIRQQQRQLVEFCGANEFKVARRRMRHLAPWNVTPVPAMHFAVTRANTSRASITPQLRERCERLASKVLAVHMHEAVAKSALS